MSNRESTRAPHDHAVSFYHDDLELVAQVAAFVMGGLALGEHVIVVATARHRELFDQALLSMGCDPSGARDEGRLVSLDAAELLAGFSSGGILDTSRFAATVGRLVGASAEGGSRVRIFGEMVALLWDEGNVVAALELEELWNDLATRQDFSLSCAYQVSVVGRSALADVDRVCAAHSRVQPPGQYASGVTNPRGSFGSVSQGSQIFVCVPAAVPAVRRFVARVLEDWGQDDLIPDAILVASELATNAVRHAHSPFRVSITRSGSATRIAVEDMDRLHPAVGPTAGESTSGRGVFIVDDVCDAWGSDRLPDGKVVWGELALSRGLETSLSSGG